VHSLKQRVSEYEDESRGTQREFGQTTGRTNESVGY
jgi:hypothetical protein